MFKKYSAYVAVVVLCALFFPLCTGLNRTNCSGNSTYAGSRLPQQFTGTFRWEGIDETHRVIINIYSVKSVSGVITATGKGTYNTAGVVTIINVKIVINTSTGFFEMWESDPDRENGFITAGSHTGAISPDLTRIEAVWTTAGTGARGRLVLSATGRGNQR